MGTISETLIRGSNQNETIVIAARPEISLSSFDVTISFAGYKVHETSVTLFHIERFLEALAEFERTRTGQAILTGTYDFALKISAHEHRGDALVEFVLANALPTASGRAGQCRIEGDFVVNGEWVGVLNGDLYRLLKSSD